MNHQTATPPTRRQLLRIAAIATLAAAALLLAVVLPAEFHVDPLGTGKLSGLMPLSAPAASAPALTSAAAAATGATQLAARFYADGFRSDTIEIKLAPGGEFGHDELEWKVRMRAGQSLVYAWRADTPPDGLYFDFHGQSDTPPKAMVQSYQAGIGAASQGMLVAPFDGIHGWFLQNQTSKPVLVRLTLSGFYTLRSDPFAPQ